MMGGFLASKSELFATIEKPWKGGLTNVSFGMLMVQLPSKIDGENANDGTCRS